ncbi:MAG TPA: type II CAAX endopeptidase family protein [Chloroflexia bacterium]|nr:type II CAAX endopeptidase family protein [Chloroflexia bacterium]
MLRRFPARPARLPLMFGAYLVLISAAEGVTALVDPLIGVGFHALLLIGLLVHGAFGRTTVERQLALGLSLAPLIRLLSLMVPLITFPQQLWYPLVSGPLLWAAWLVARHAGLAPRALGLRAGRWRLQLLVMAGGLGLGASEYAILHAVPRISLADPWAVGELAVSLLLFTGVSEELIFRGVIQAVAGPALGRGSLLYVALLFGVLHTGYHSLLDVVFVTGVGLLFSYIVRWGGSLLGVALAHGLANVTLFLIMPYLAGAPPALGALAMGGMGAGTLAGLVGIGLLWRARVHPAAAGEAPPEPVLPADLSPPPPAPAPLRRLRAPVEPAGGRGPQVPGAGAWDTWRAATLAGLLAAGEAPPRSRDN